MQHPWQPARLNRWNSVCSLLHSLCSTCCINQTEEPCEPPARCSTNITSQAIIAVQGSVYAHNHCQKEQSSTQQDKSPTGRALEMLQARPPADCVLLEGLSRALKIRPSGIALNLKAASGLAQGPVASDTLESGSIQGSEATAKPRSHASFARSHLEAAVQCPTLSATVELAHTTSCFPCKVF